MKGEGGIVVEHKVERTDGRGILAGDYLNQNRYGMASAVAVVMVLILAGISIVRVRKMLKREQAYD